MRSEIVVKARDYTDGWVQWLGNNKTRMNGVKVGVVEVVVPAFASLGAVFEHLFSGGKELLHFSVPKVWVHLNHALEHLMACVQIPLLMFNVPAMIIFRLWNPGFRRDTEESEIRLTETNVPKVSSPSPTPLPPQTPGSSSQPVGAVFTLSAPEHLKDVTISVFVNPPEQTTNVLAVLRRQLHVPPTPTKP